MLQFYSKNMEKSPLFFRMTQYLHLFKGDNFKRIWSLYAIYCKAMGRTIGDVSFRADLGSINVMGIKRDPEVSFNLPGAFYNDVLIISKNTKKGQDFYVYKATMDPKSKRNKIAHLLLGMYDSYKIRPHRWIPTRTAICQDRNEVFLARTDKLGCVINVSPYKGFFGINIHDSDIYTNTSLGCTVLEKDSLLNNNHYTTSFKPLLKNIGNPNNIVYAVTSLRAIERLFYVVTVGKDLRSLPIENTPIFKVAVNKKASSLKKYFL